MTYHWRWTSAGFGEYVRTVVSLLCSRLLRCRTRQRSLGGAGTTARTFRLRTTGEDAGRAAHRSLKDRFAHNELADYRPRHARVKKLGLLRKSFGDFTRLRAVRRACADGVRRVGRRARSSTGR